MGVNSCLVRQIGSDYSQNTAADLVTAQKPQLSSIKDMI